MRKMTLINAGLSVGLALLLAPGCARRHDPTNPVAEARDGGISNFTHDYGPDGYGYLPANGDGLTLTESPLRKSKHYLPPGYRQPGEGRPFPVLYLLLDYGGNGSTDDVTDQYYLEIGLRLMVDSLINGGVIKPMIIGTVDLYNAYGGSWFASNTTQGLYEECLIEFISYTNTALNSSTQNGRDSRAISGVGMGGYGAVITAMRHPELFASASSINGHLAFTRSSDIYDYHGVEDWAVHVFEENFVTPLPPGQTPTPEATREYYEMDPDINRPRRKPYTNLVFSMAAAFSPFDTASIVPADSVTWMNAAVVGGEERDWKVTLPFDFTGLMWPHAWAKWTPFDAAQILWADPVALSGVETLILAGTTAEFDILPQNRIFRDVAEARGASTVHYQEFEGYGDYPTARRRYLDRTLRVVLQFHSDQFVDPWTPGP